MEGKDSKPIVARIVMPLPPDYRSYHQGIAADHPDLQFVVLDRLEISGNAVMEDIHVSGGPTASHLVEELQSGRGVRSAEQIAAMGREATYRMSIDMPPLAKLLRELEVIVRYPVSFGGAEGRLLVASSKAKVRVLLSRMKKFAPDTRIESIRTDILEGPQALLTPKQQELFRLAMASGYWDVPRRATMTDIAERFHVAKSSISEMLATIEKKLLHEIKVTDEYLLDHRTAQH